MTPWCVITSTILTWWVHTPNVWVGVRSFCSRQQHEHGTMPFVMRQQHEQEDEVWRWRFGRSVIWMHHLLKRTGILWRAQLWLWVADRWGPPGMGASRHGAHRSVTERQGTAGFARCWSTVFGISYSRGQNFSFLEPFIYNLLEIF
jgi:hypothetical protein